MQAPAVERRLAAILAADMVGYSRLMGVDETGTLARLRERRLELIDPAIARNNGRIIKTMGDGLLAEFHSVVDAVACAVEVQDRLARRNADLPAEARIVFRIGINVGDVIVEHGDIFGDGVNIAARLQEQAAPGGICISAAVHDHVADKLDLSFEDCGEQSLKNIARPTRLFQIRLGAASGAAAAPRAAPEPAAAKPSIAVLPFVNMSGDPEQEFFADGLTEDILTQLSRFRGLLVISRNSAFVYKGKPVNIQQVARELGAQYVVEGSVRKAANRVRVTVQLIDAETDRHLWAERYDRELADIFAIQDEITSAIVAVLPGRVEAAAQERVKRKTTDNLAAYEFVLTGKILHHRSNRADNAEALHMLERAIALDPKYAHAHAWRACTLGQSWVYGWCDDRDATLGQVMEELQTALALDDNDSDVHRILAAANLAQDKHDQSIYHQQRALDLNPNDDLIVVQQGELLTWLGSPGEGVVWIRKAMRLNPYHPERFWSHLGRAYFVARRYGDAIEAFKHISRPDVMQHSYLASACARQGDEAGARRHVQEILKQDPQMTVASLLATTHYRDAGDREHHLQALAEAGLPA